MLPIVHYVESRIHIDENPAILSVPTSLSVPAVWFALITVVACLLVPGSLEPIFSLVLAGAPYNLGARAADKVDGPR